MRVIRLIIYEGNKEWVEKTIDKSIHGNKIISEKDGNIISAFTLGTLPDELKVSLNSIHGKEE